MTSASSLRDVDAIVVGGIARGPDSTGCDAHVARLVRGLERSGLAVGRVDGSDGAARDALAEALTHAVRLGEDESRAASQGPGATTRAERRARPRALLIVGLDAKGAVDASAAAGVLRDEKLRWHARRFAARGGVVLVNGVGGALDAALQEWFKKPWTSGLTRRNREWRYNDDAAWGEGYFARFNASSENGAPPVSFALAAAAELESVSPAERVYFAEAPKEDARLGSSRVPTETSVSAVNPGRKEKKTRERTFAWSGYRHDDDAEKNASSRKSRAGVAVSLGAYGGGHVGCFADLNMEPCTVSALTALVLAAPGAGTKSAAARLRRSPLRSEFTDAPGSDADGAFFPLEKINKNAPSKRAFVAYAFVTTLVTGAFFVFLARLIVRSNL